MLSQTASGILEEVRRALDALPEDAEEKAAGCIRRHGRVFLYGAGRTGLVLKMLAMRLMQAGKCVYAVGETVTPALEQGDLLLLASASGATRSVCDYARTAVQAGADLFIVTAARESELTRIAPAGVYIPSGSKDRSGSSAQVMGSLFEQSLMIFCDCVAERLAEDRDAMRRRHANLE